MSLVVCHFWMEVNVLLCLSTFKKSLLGIKKLNTYLLKKNNKTKLPNQSLIILSYYWVFYRDLYQQRLLHGFTDMQSSFLDFPLT